ncbi:uncharacterized protein LOC107461319 [Arachis duranensis]|uniref:Uncharacterized protein LOC107461319 n=1 Tax=Arachis duranensis TaxID=130453 RepID=A0A6P4B2X6_ARADU|nr:uncharacterized protein LOC107461319 [Arachis duranensis]
MLQEATKANYGFRPSYRKVWMAKQKAIAHIYGDWEDSYAELPRLMFWVQSTMVDTVAVLKTSPVRVGNQVDESTFYFHRFFWTFLSCNEAFQHLWRYFATGYSARQNSNILPIVFALVEEENAESWSLFLSNLRQHVTPQKCILVISDRHNGIEVALEAPDSGWLPPRAYRAFCIHHVAANFNLSFKGQDARRLLENAAYAKTETEFDYWFDIMWTENPTMCDCANRMKYDK